MRIIAVTIWYNENPEHLSALTRSLAGFADGLVAIDGAFAYFPDASTRSPQEQVDALVKGCEEANVELLLHRPNRLWEGEVEKRNASLRLAGTLDADWVVVVDGDMEIGSRNGARDALAATKFDVAVIRVEDDETTPNRQWCDARFVYRYSDSLRWWRSHYIVRNSERTLLCPLPPFERIALALPPLAPALSLRSLTLIHHPKERERRDAALASYDRRDESGIEAHGF